MSFVAVLESATPAHAQAPAHGENADERAVRLFHEGRRSLAAKRGAEACRLFRESLALKRSPGILLNVGDCQVRENDLVGALHTFESALELAEQSAPSSARGAWLTDARREITALTPQVARLVLRVSETPELQLTLDGKAFVPRAEGSWLEPGQHVIEASAPGHVAQRREFAAAAGEQLEFSLPPLQPVAAPPPAALAPASAAPRPGAEPRAQSGSALPWVLIGSGAAAVGAGVVTGLITLNKGRELESSCPNRRCPNPADVPGWQDKIDSADRLALITNALWGVGLATAGVGVTLLLVGSGESESPSALVQGGCIPGRCGLELSGRF